MKMWHQYGSEHSANLVMIGHFKDVATTTKAKEIIDALTKQVEEDQAKGTLAIGAPSERYSNEMLDLFRHLNIASIGPQELEQFVYETSIKTEENKIALTTEEMDISAFLKVMFNLGAHIEIYSAHDYPDTGYGRGR